MNLHGWSEEHLKNVAIHRLRAVPFTPMGTLKETLEIFPWRFDEESSEDRLINRGIFEVNPGHCFGRSALMHALADSYGDECYYGEVMLDGLADYMIDIIKTALRNRTYDKTMLEELFMYEEPHGVIVFLDKSHYDPISREIKRNLVHPEVRSHDPWKALFSGILIGLAHNTNDNDEKDEYLSQAEQVCPASVTVREVRVIEDFLRGRVQVDDLARLVSIRPTGLFLYLYMLQDERTALEIMHERYGDIITGLIVAHYGRMFNVGP